MSHTYTCVLFHCVFSTKERRKIIPADLQPRLWAYMGCVARKREMKTLGVGGTDDHVHLLLSLPASLPIARAMREIKSESSRWMQADCGLPGFEWQEGYGAFSVGWAQVEATLAYIANQQAHHQKRDFQEEFMAFLKKNTRSNTIRDMFGDEHRAALRGAGGILRFSQGVVCPSADSGLGYFRSVPPGREQRLGC